MRRRTVLGSAIAGMLAGAASAVRPAAAQEAAPGSLADHPLTGVWLAMANPPLPDDPQVAAPSVYGADGTVLLVFPLTQAGPQGVQFNSPAVGTWEADGERRGHFTAVQTLSDTAGTYLGSVTIDGYPEVGADGQTFVDDGSKAVITFRDAAGAVVQEVTGVFARPVTATRMGVGAPGFPAATPTAGTPTG